MQFQNTMNGHTVTLNRWSEFFGCLFFGTLYFLYRKHYGHAFISLILAMATGGISWLLYPFFTEQINETAFLNKGWLRLDVNKQLDQSKA